jgi:hypothetical protein
MISIDILALRTNNSWKIWIVKFDLMTRLGGAYHEKWSDGLGRLDVDRQWDDIDGLGDEVSVEG